MGCTVLTICPICGKKLQIEKLNCSECGTSYEGHFTFDKFSYLTQEQKYFIEIFMKCRGNIREVEKELDISYPTVRSKLDDVVRSLGYDVTSTEKVNTNRKEVLDMLSDGQISVDQAIKMLKE